MALVVLPSVGGGSDFHVNQHMKPEEFMREYFDERTDRIRSELVRREPFRQKFYTSDCYFDSQRGSVENSEAEEILSVTPVNGEAQVITSGIGSPQRRWRLRYHLQPVGDRWLICRAEFECSICRGTGKKKGGVSDCLVCKGKGWMYPNDSA